MLWILSTGWASRHSPRRYPVPTGALIASPAGSGAAHHERDYASELRLPTPVREVHELSVGLDRMRAELVGANEQLRHADPGKEADRGTTGRPERQLQHQQRVEIVGTLAGGIATSSTTCWCRSRS